MQRPTPVSQDLAHRDSEHSARSSNSKEAHILSCERCARRKIKCDRSGDGCLNCKKAGVHCHVVARPRLPRGRRTKSTKANSDLKARLLRLEGLVSSYAQHGDESSSRSSDTPPTIFEDDSLSGNAPKGVSKYVGREFWSGLSQEITEVREALEYSDEDDDAGPESNNAPDSAGAADGSHRPSNHSLLGIASNFAKAIDPALTEIPITSALCEIYLYRFAMLVRVGHGPAFRALMCGQPYLDYPSDHLAPRLLTYAICYAATVTLREAECHQRFATDKQTLRDKYRVATEAYLAKADLLTTLDLTVLESFIIYINALRSEDSSRKSWTLTAVALRIAHAMNLQLDDNDMNLRPFQREMRRRAWSQIRLADIRASYDRGTSLMTSDELSRLPSPLNINDADFSFDTDEPLQGREGYTDMTHVLIILEGSGLSPIITRRARRFQADNAQVSAEDTEAYSREQVVAWFRELDRKYLQHCDIRVDMQWYTKQVATTIAATSLLFAARPLRADTGMQGDLSSDSILLLALDVVEKALRIHANPQAQAWDWYVFVPWHSLAVAVAELCNRPSGPLVERAWPIVEDGFAHYSARVADTDKGMLWKPLAKLLRKARKVRSAYLESNQHNYSGASGQRPESPSQSNRSVNYVTPAPSRVQAMGHVDFGTMDMRMQAPGEDDLEWLQSLISNQQPLFPTDATSNSWDQWTAFVQNMESSPDDALLSYGTQPGSWPDIDMPGKDFIGGPVTRNPNALWLAGSDGFLPPVQY